MCMVALETLTPETLIGRLVQTIQKYRTVSTVDERPDEVIININNYLDFSQLMEVQHIICPTSEVNDNIRVYRAVETGYDVRISLTA